MQKILRLFFIFLIISVQALFAYEKPPEVSQEVWNQLEPYFLPASHPMKHKLDKLFKKRVLASASTLKHYHFQNTNAGRYSHMVVSTHPSLTGIILKFATDDCNYVEWPQLKKRVESSHKLQFAITAFGYDKYFKVPKKWIYPLPLYPTASRLSPYPKYFILVAEDMNIMPRGQNYFQWKDSTFATREMLEALFHILESEGMSDSTVAFNIPFARDGKIAFIDLEHYNSWPIPYHRLLMYLNDEGQRMWTEITGNRW